MNILVTGASRGIGKVICEELAKIDNANIFATARNEKLLKNYKNYCVADLLTDKGRDILAKYIINNNIDVLINNAGDYVYSSIENVEFDTIEKIMKLNLEIPMFLISKAVPFMKTQHFGRIINIGSISGVMGEANASLYSATKAGLIGAAKALALELAEFGITVNTINPGWVETNLGEKSIEESDFSKEEILDCIPQKRFITPSEIAGMIKYLISSDAKGVTGQSINLCAGLSVGY